MTLAESFDDYMRSIYPVLPPRGSEQYEQIELAFWGGMIAMWREANRAVDEKRDPTEFAATVQAEISERVHRTMLEVMAEQQMRPPRTTH